MMGLTALVRLFYDTKNNCKIDNMFMDSTTFCFINDCHSLGLLYNFCENWAEEIFAFNMIWTTLVSAEFADFSYEVDYKYYHSIGEYSALFFTNVIGFRPRDAYNYDPNDDEFGDDIEMKPELVPDTSKLFDPNFFN